MKKILFLAVVAFSLVAGCSKDKTEDNKYFLKFSIGGQQKIFTAYTAGDFQQTSSYTDLNLTGSDNPTPYENGAIIYINNYPGGLPITTGVYEDNSTNFTLLATYGINGVEYRAGESVSETAALNNIVNHQRFKVTITEITSTAITGTFSGDYYEFGDVHGQKLQIRDGQFKVQVK